VILFWHFLRKREEEKEETKTDFFPNLGFPTFSAAVRV
jgi:hypothetical protein